jgi:hypothetical protein
MYRAAIRGREYGRHKQKRLKKSVGGIEKKKALHDGEIIEITKEGDQEQTRVAISVIDESECDCGPPKPRKNKHGSASTPR